ncbi:fimbrial protein [Atlantibacter sp.]|uniref:fimbrial protein n=1 Tax=Atlantibacter sp. TaxID=1903473 RepID=UPI0028A8A5C0|nr:fimbrial protein [Atlantibacter sp.]
MRLFLWGVLLWPLCFFSSVASAWDCDNLSTSATAPAPAPSITIPRSLPVGAVIGTQVSTGVINAFNCYNTPSGVISNQNLGVESYGEYVMMIDGRRVYKTNIEGVGYAIGGTASSECNVTAWVSGSGTIRNRVDTVSLCANQQGMFAVQPIKGQVFITYYKTATVTGSGTVAAKQAGALVLLNNSLLWQDPPIVVTSSAFNITTLGCTVDKPIISVPMGDVPGNAFHGQGTWPGDIRTQTFNLPLTCFAGTKVEMQIDGNVNDATNGVLNLSSSGEGSAKGVGVQVLYNNAPLQLAAPIATGTASINGSYTIPLKARYYQTGPKVTGGTANATATFTLTYD